MDALAGGPICYSSLEADEFDELSAYDDDGAPDLDDVTLGERPELSIKDRFVQPRFDKLLAASSATCHELLRELLGRVQMIHHDVLIESSMRHLVVDFVLAGMEGHYEQRSQADASSATWATSTGKTGTQGFELLPNVSADLVLDGEPLISCQYFASAASKNQSKTDDKRLSERFGSDTLTKLGGAKVLMQFIGVVCADTGAPVYAERLPFGISGDVIAVEGDIDGYMEVVGPSVHPVAIATREQHEGGYPSVTVTSTSVQPTGGSAARGPAVPKPPKQAQEDSVTSAKQAIRPRTRESSKGR